MSRPDDADDGTTHDHRPQGFSVALAGALVVSTLGSIGLLVSYWADLGPQAQGLSLAVAAAGLAVAAASWVAHAVPDRIAIEERGPMASDEGQRRAAAAEARLPTPPLPARRALLGLLGLAGSTLVAALASPLRSLGPSPFPELRRTGWRSGRRLVDEAGRPVHVGELDIGSFVTVFPEDQAESHRAQSQVVLIRMSEDDLDMDDDHRRLTVGGHVAYSKVCTHAGCPVGLYDADTHELLCPCHQSVFRADQAARTVFGPAARPLPQLPLALDGDGFLVADDDFAEPPGPSWWSRPT